MNSIHKLEIKWEDYVPSLPVQRAVTYFNQYSLEELLRELPEAKLYSGRQVTFDYRIYSRHDLKDIEKVYIMINGFAERAATPDSGLKNLLTDLILKQTETHKYAIIVVGGLVTFPFSLRDKLLKKGSGALAVLADGVADLLESTFDNQVAATVSGYSLGGVLAPLIARAIDQRKIATIDQVCCGEPNYISVSSTKKQLLQRVSHATAYRNDQIKATAIQAYIDVKQTPSSKWAMLTYRAKQYRPLLLRILSMRLIVKDLALQARVYPPASQAIQMQEALSHLTRKGIRVNLLHAEYSTICHAEPFSKLVDNLKKDNNGQLSIITIRGEKADHGIEECRTLSTPFLIRPEMYWLAS
jgi:hypothetical protein